MGLLWPFEPKFDVAASNSVCSTSAYSESSVPALVKIAGVDRTPPPHTWPKLRSDHIEKVEIKCMDSAGGKTPTKQKKFIQTLINHRHIYIMNEMNKNKEQPKCIVLL